MRKALFILPLVVISIAEIGVANRRADSPAPLGHCYHWLNEAGNGYLTYKYNYARQKNGEFSFYTDGAGGAVAGPGIYCGKTPIDSFTYGDRVVRIEFVDDVVMYDEVNRTQYCGKNGKLLGAAECAKKTWDVKYYYAGSAADWYVIRNPQAIKLWTANDDQLVQDLKAIKTDGGAAADAHMDATLARIANEVKTVGKHTYLNGNGRMSFAELIKDDKRMLSIPPLSVISMALGDTSGKVDKATRARVIRAQFTRALFDTDLDLSDFNETLKLDASLKAELVDALAGIQGEQIARTNLAVFISLLDKYMDPTRLSDEMARDLWVRSFSNVGPLVTLVQNPLGKGGVFRRQFAAALPPVAQLMKQIEDKRAQKNLPAVLRLINDYTDPASGASYIDYTVEGFTRILMSSGARQAEEVFAKINNPALRRDQAIQSVFAALAQSGFQGRDPLAVANLLEKTGDAIPAALKKGYRDQIVGLALPMGDRASYILLDEYKQGRITLPAMFSREIYLTKIFERATAEHGAPKNVQPKNLTNAYRLLMQGFYSYWADLARAAKSDKEKANVMQEASSFFTNLAERMRGPAADNYGYTALQLAGTFMGAGKTFEHPIEFVLDASKTDAQAATLIDRLVPRANDASVIEYLISRGADPQAKLLMSKTVTYFLASLPGILHAPEFRYVQESEKKLWDNVVHSKRYQNSRGRVPSTICQAAKVVLGEKAYFEKNFSTQAPRLQQAMVGVLASDLCKGK